MLMSQRQSSVSVIIRPQTDQSFALLDRPILGLYFGANVSCKMLGVGLGRAAVSYCIGGQCLVHACGTALFMCAYVLLIMPC